MKQGINPVIILIVSILFFIFWTVLLTCEPAKGDDSYKIQDWDWPTGVIYVDSLGKEGVSTIAAGIAACPTNGSIKIWPGIYSLDKHTAIPNNIAIYGDGADPIDITLTGVDSILYLTATNVEFGNLTLSGTGTGQLIYSSGTSSITFRNVAIQCSTFNDDGVATYFYDDCLWYPLKQQGWIFTGNSHCQDRDVGIDLSGAGGSANAAKAGFQIKDGGIMFDYNGMINVNPGSSNPTPSIWLHGTGRPAYHGFNLRVIRDYGGAVLALEDTASAVIAGSYLESTSGSIAPTILVGDTASITIIKSTINGATPDSSIRYASLAAGTAYDALFLGKKDLHDTFTRLSSEVETEIVETISLVGYLVTWTNMAEAVVEISNAVRFKMDLTNVDSVCFSGRITTVGTATALAWASYSTDESTWAALSDSVSLAAIATVYSGWQAIPTAAKAVVFVSLHGNGGNGVADPVVANAKLQLKRGME